MTAPSSAGGPEGSCAVGVATGPEGLPWPVGDPDQLRVSAQHAVGLAEETERQRAALLAAGQGINPWVGIAHQSYLAELDRHARAVDRISVNFRQAAGGLADLAGVLDQAQESVRRLAAQLSEARETAARAARQAEHARAEATAAAQHAAAVAPVSGGLDPAAQRAQAAEESALAAEAEAAHTAERSQQAERHCQEQAEQACAEARRQDQRSATTIEALEWLPHAPGLALGKAEGTARYLSKEPELLPDQSARDAAKRWATRLRGAGGVLAFGGGFGAQWVKDADRRPNMDTDERAGRAVAEGGSAAAGAAAGALIGSTVLPGAGTIVGGMVGGAVGSWGLAKVNDPAVKAVGDFSDKAGDWTGRKFGQAKRAAGKAWDGLTPW